MKVRRAIDIPLTVGTVLAKDGAWDRKYKVISVTQSEPDKAIVEIVNLGNIYSCGLKIPARRTIKRSLEMKRIRGTWASKWGGSFHPFSRNGHLKNRYVQIQEVP